MLRMLTLLGRKNLPVIGKVEANSGDNQKPVNSLLCRKKPMRGLRTNICERPTVMAFRNKGNP